jgi:hypothetical protein
MYDLLIARIARRAANPDTQVDMECVAQPSIAPALRNVDAKQSERELGFALPELLKIVYEQVGNGGFGPGYGLMGVRSGATDDQGQDAVDAYRTYSSPDPDDPTWIWREGLLPVCHWGCAIYSCIDCKNAEFAVVTFDPNIREDTWAECFIPSRRNLESWLNAWSMGVALWDEIHSAT